MARPASALDLPLHAHLGVMAQCFFAKLTRRRLERGVFRSVDDLKAAIDRFLAETNADPKPFVWTAKPTRILAASNEGSKRY